MWLQVKHKVGAQQMSTTVVTCQPEEFTEFSSSPINRILSEVNIFVQDHTANE